MADIVTRLRQDFTSDPIPLHAEAAAEIERLRVALKEIQAYSVGDPRPRHTWYYDRAETALRDQQNAGDSK